MNESDITKLNIHMGIIEKNLGYIEEISEAFHKIGLTVTCDLLNDHIQEIKMHLEFVEKLITK